ncbi:hypothetical protein E2562_006095 [Oryza meyeriana var. granulata]|uniref:PARP catalytic domain-containing protein n=1 Tax=Oryza meyeriana var. granulata TaxID=110450 RepID=A0A6G1EVT5_9ORYZ|nr:hypothetical protein E2562_006095 [Oryza meyeriana var. granulata]
MATAWVRSLSCRSYGVADAVVSPSPSKKLQSPPMPMLPAVSCAAAEDVRDSVAFLRHNAKKPRQERRRAAEERPRREPRPRPRPKKKPKQVEAAAVAFMPSPALASAPAVSSAFLTMAELPKGHSSRRVVELIFSSGWGVAASAAPEPAVEAMFRVHSAARAVARFEETRAAARAHGAAARCGADGNEMMRFQCRAAAGPGGVFGAGVATCRLGATDTAVRTFAGSGAAHASAGACPGRRAMLVCRVIAGRVRPAHDHSRHHASDYDSVDMGNGELVVLDSRAVLPCFLIIYKV